MAQKHRLTYTVQSHPEGVERAPEGDDWGACDQIVYLLTSRRGEIAHTTLGSVNGLDIENGMSTFDLFQQWILMGRLLEQQLDGMPQAIAGEPMRIATRMGGVDRVMQMRDTGYPGQGDPS